MDKRTLKALQGSIKKWEGIVAGNGIDSGWPSCPLCVEFIRKDIGCSGCPVSDASGAQFCRNTPYKDWEEAQDHTHYQSYAYFNDKKAADDETVMCAVLELEFLKSLLPAKRHAR